MGGMPVVVITEQHVQQAKLRGACHSGIQGIVGRDLTSLPWGSLMWIESVGMWDEASTCRMADGDTLVMACVPLVLFSNYGYGYDEGDGSGYGYGSGSGYGYGYGDGDGFGDGYGDGYGYGDGNGSGRGDSDGRG